MCVCFVAVGKLAGGCGVLAANRVAAQRYFSTQDASNLGKSLFWGGANVETSHRYIVTEPFPVTKILTTGGEARIELDPFTTENNGCSA